MTDAKDSPLREAAPSGNPNSYATKEQITGYLRSVSPGPVTASGQGYLDLADTYDKAMTELRGFAHDLADAWKGPASNAAQKQLRELFSAAFEISGSSQQIGTAVKTHGSSYLSWYQKNMPTPKTLEEARQWMQGANERATETWSAFPTDISTALPPVESGRRDLGSPAGEPGSGSASGNPGGGGGVGGSAGAGSAGSGPGLPGGFSSDPANGGTPGRPPNFDHGAPGAVIGRPANSPGQAGVPLPASDIGGDTQLSGFSPSGTTTGSVGFDGANPYGISSKDVGGLGPVGSVGSTLPGGIVGGAPPGGGGSRPGVGIGGVPGPGAIGGPTSRGLPTGGTSSSAGRPGMPGSGIHGTPAHGGRENKERERDAWLPADQDIWGGDIEAVPGVIGDAPPKPATPERSSTSSQTDEATLLHRLLARLTELESREVVAPPPPAPPRMEWTD